MVPIRVYRKCLFQNLAFVFISRLSLFAKVPTWCSEIPKKVSRHVVFAVSTRSSAVSSLEFSSRILFMTSYTRKKN